MPMELMFAYAETPTSIAARMRRPDSREERRRLDRATCQIFERMHSRLPSGCTVKDMTFEMQRRGGMSVFLRLQVEGRGWVSERGLSDIRVDGVDGEAFLRLRLARRVRVPVPE